MCKVKRVYIPEQHKLFWNNFNCNSKVGLSATQLSIIVLGYDLNYPLVWL